MYRRTSGGSMKSTSGTILRHIDLVFELARVARASVPKLCLSHAKVDIKVDIDFYAFSVVPSLQLPIRLNRHRFEYFTWFTEHCNNFRFHHARLNSCEGVLIHSSTGTRGEPGIQKDDCGTSKRQHQQHPTATSKTAWTRSIHDRNRPSANRPRSAPIPVRACERSCSLRTKKRPGSFWLLQLLFVSLTVRIKL